METVVGTQVMYIDRSGNPGPDRVVAGYDPVLGITVQDMERADIRGCITPHYFGGGYAGAFFEASRMIRKGYFDVRVIDAYAIEPVGSRGGGFFAPTCPFAGGAK